MKQINYLLKPVSSACNMRCAYCFYTDETENRAVPCAGRMSAETTDLLLHRTFAETEPGGCVTFAFQGGEPTLAGLTFYQSFVRAVQAQCPPRVRVEYAIQTNGLLINEEWAAFFAQEHFLVGLSLDGCKELHDLNRRTAADGDTWKSVTGALRILQQHGVAVNILCVVTDSHVRKTQKIYTKLKKHGVDHMQFIACMEPIGAARGDAPFALSPQAYGDFLCRLFDLWYRDWMQGMPVSIRLFEDYVHLLLRDGASTCSTCGQCGGYLVVEADGSVYPCDFYCLDDWRLGSLQENTLAELLTGETMQHFRTRTAAKPPECITCRLRPLCSGGCPHDWTNTNTVVHNYYCEAFTALLHHALPRLQQIAAEEAAWRRRCR